MPRADRARAICGAWGFRGIGGHAVRVRRALGSIAAEVWRRRARQTRMTAAGPGRQDMARVLDWREGGRGEALGTDWYGGWDSASRQHTSITGNQ